MEQLGFLPSHPPLPVKLQGNRYELVREIEYAFNPGRRLLDTCMRMFEEHKETIHSIEHDEKTWNVLDFKVLKLQEVKCNKGWLYQERLNVPESAVLDHKIIFLGMTLPGFGTVQVEYWFHKNLQGKGRETVWHKGILFTGTDKIHTNPMPKEEANKLSLLLKRVQITEK